MTKQEFESATEPLCMIVSLEPKTGKVIYDTYDWADREYWMEVFKKDFPDMLHFSTINESGIAARKIHFGLNAQNPR